jgi:hypothetical protein
MPLSLCCDAEGPLQVRGATVHEARMPLELGG